MSASYTPYEHLNWLKDFQASDYDISRESVIALAAQFKTLARELAPKLKQAEAALKAGADTAHREDDARIGKITDRPEDRKPPLPRLVTTAISNAHVLIKGLAGSSYFKLDDKPKTAADGRILHPNQLAGALESVSYRNADLYTRQHAAQKLVEATYDILITLHDVATGLQHSDAYLETHPESVPASIKAAGAEANAQLAILAPSLDKLEAVADQFRSAVAGRTALSPLHLQPQSGSADATAETEAEPEPRIHAATATSGPLARAQGALLLDETLTDFRVEAQRVDWLSVHRAMRGFRHQMDSLRAYLNQEFTHFKRLQSGLGEDTRFNNYLLTLDGLRQHYAFDALARLDAYRPASVTLRDTAMDIQYGTQHPDAGLGRPGDARDLATHMLAVDQGPAESIHAAQIHAHQLSALLAAHGSLRAQTRQLVAAAEDFCQEAERPDASPQQRHARQKIKELNQAALTMVGQYDQFLAAHLNAIERGQEGPSMSDYAKANAATSQTTGRQ